MRCVLLGLVVLVSGCRGGLAGGMFTRGGVSYAVVEPPAPWSRVGFDDNDLAWLSPSGHVIAVNATCTGHEDPQLEVLTNHLMIGFTDREWVSKKKFQLDGRDALRSLVRAKLDGVSRSLDLVVLKKNGCVHDFSYISPAGLEAEHQAEFDALVAGFRQERAP
ncbi:MAG: hypothetical protein Q8L48_40805 [Archangium sp.]|nr:hypothetical protein [Archangium sp.]